MHPALLNDERNALKDAARKLAPGDFRERSAVRNDAGRAVADDRRRHDPDPQERNRTGAVCRLTEFG